MLTPFDKASHLWRRAGFGATTQQIHETVERGIEATLDDVLDLEKEDADMEEELSKLSGDVFDLNNNGEDVRCWWLYRMIHSRRPLREKLTLFWHGHFATSLAKVERPAHMLDQNRTLRRLADAPFRQILDAISRDPAMLVYLDGNSNREGKPNENYARELFELFRWESATIRRRTSRSRRARSRAGGGRWHVPLRSQATRPGAEDLDRPQRKSRRPRHPRCDRGASGDSQLSRAKALPLLCQQ